MELFDISPFIRFASRFPLMPKNGKFITVDSRLFYICDGNGKMNIEGNVFSFEPQDVLLIPAGTIYQFVDCPEIDIISINFDYTGDNRLLTKEREPINIMYRNIDNLKIHSTVFDEPSILNCPLKCHDTCMIYEKLNEIILERTLNRPYCTERVSTILKDCIIKLVRNHNHPSSTSTIQKLKKVAQYIQEHYKSKISNEELADLVNYHPNYLNRRWIEWQSCTLHQYLIQYRLSIAEQLLVSTDKSIAEIADDTGFASFVSLNSNFKKKHGIPPSKYREKHTNFQQ